jgi:serine/threonine protein kinase
MQYLHSEHCIHGSLNRENILIAEEGHPIIISHGLEGIANSVKSRIQRYSFPFIAPEIFFGEKKIESSDVFRDGQIPFREMDGQTAIPYRLMNFRTFPFRKFGQTPPVLVSLLYRCWSSFQSRNSRPKFAQFVRIFQTHSCKRYIPGRSKKLFGNH